jgi:predicted transcriptional regulator
MAPAPPLIRVCAGAFQNAYLEGEAEAMEVHFPPELEAKLKHSAARQGRNAEELVQEILMSHFEEETRFVEAVRLGEEALQRGEYLTHDQVGQRLHGFCVPDGRS